MIAVDLPSGLHPDTGLTADDVVLPAAVTVTFGAVKAGLVRGRGPSLRAGSCSSISGWAACGDASTGSATGGWRGSVSVSFRAGLALRDY